MLNLKRFISNICLFAISLNSVAQNNAISLEKLERVLINHYQEQASKLKIEAAQFLIKHINIHKGEYCSWFDSQNNNITRCAF